MKHDSRLRVVLILGGLVFGMGSTLSAQDSVTYRSGYNRADRGGHYLSVGNGTSSWLTKASYNGSDWQWMRAEADATPQIQLGPFTSSAFRVWEHSRGWGNRFGDSQTRLLFVNISGNWADVNVSAWGDFWRWNQKLFDHSFTFFYIGPVPVDVRITASVGANAYLHWQDTGDRHGVRIGVGAGFGGSVGVELGWDCWIAGVKAGVEGSLTILRRDVSLRTLSPKQGSSGRVEVVGNYNMRSEGGINVYVRAWFGRDWWKVEHQTNLISVPLPSYVWHDYDFLRG